MSQNKIDQIKTLYSELIKLLPEHEVRASMVSAVGTSSQFKNLGNESLDRLIDRMSELKLRSIAKKK